MSGRSFTLLQLAEDLPVLYAAARAPAAQESDSRSFWTALLTAWAQLSGKAIRIDTEQPPQQDPEPEYRLIRIDITADAFHESTKWRFHLIICQAKGHNARSSRYNDVESQVHRDCEAWLKERGNMPGSVYAMCTVGTACRMFRASIERDDEPWVPMWHAQGFLDADANAADPDRGATLWGALQETLARSPLPIADKSYM
ncbi:hypothetical protein LTR78_010590 [Recurvomyces mirabilis]|uniref:Uncharacterized protein n=1 Tax=Recurvomyces mirabilis TaxID=574656 RepID=A0AAE0TPH6_9PEZI|nr:hypothetical protein LTR78_010590 [Recurvomyces mirabilis]KAK5150134.1 hypothetical protein LTS14_010397 [Recurvomyces mirabilis]